MPHEFVPPQSWGIFLFSFWLVQHSFSWNYYSCHSKGKRKLSGQQHCAQTSTAPPAEYPIPPPTTLCPWLDTLSLSWVPQPPPSPNHGWNRNTKSHTEPKCQSALCLQPVLHRTPVLPELHFASLFLQTWQTKGREYKNTHYTWWLAYDIASFQSKYQTEYLLALVQFFS